MKIKIENPNNIVTKAFFQSNEFALSLYINTKDKWVGPDNVYTYNDSKSWIYCLQDDENSDSVPDNVILTAENDEDREILERLVFELACKDQLWLLLPRKDVVDT